MKVSLLISTYNWPSALDLVLKSALRQTQKPLEILIADDGSTDETKNIIDAYKKKTPLPIRHFWHKDQGFQKAFILNKALAQAKGDYIVQVDGDCIMHKDFIKDHLFCAEEGLYLYGSRVNIKQDFLPELFTQGIIDFTFLSKGIKKRTRAMRLPFFSSLYTPQATLSKKVRGCNISYWKKDLLAINGYNEDFNGWGREDSEMVIRLMNNGILGKRLRYRGIVYHIWHRIKDKSNLAENTRLEEWSKTQNLKWCPNGMDKYL